MDWQLWQMSQGAQVTSIPFAELLWRSVEALRHGIEGKKWLWLKLEWRRCHMTATKSRVFPFHCFLSRLSSLHTVETFEDDI